MEVFKIVGFSIFAVIMIIVIKEQNKEIALILTIAACVGLMIYSMSQLSGIIDMLDNLVSASGINKEFLEIILKVTAISYIIEFGKNVCIDAGQSAIATKLEMSGKVIIVALSVPLIASLVNILTGLV
jgi:stage III sporulation protein AD